MAKEDYYKILGVSKSASPDELKKAFKKKALEYHPDRYKGDKAEAEEKFKELNEAYAVLSDPKQREIYDRFGHDGLDPRIHQQTYATDPMDFFSSIFGDLFGGGFGFGSSGFGSRRPQGPTRGEDAVLNVNISLEEAYKGTSKKIKLPYKRACKACNGSRAAEGSKLVTCSTCGGSGTVERQTRQGMFVQITRSACSQCGGTGKVPEKPCPVCNGSGLSNERETISVKIPPGIDEGQLVRVQGKGYPSSNGGMAGDLILRIQLKEHSVFTRRGSDTYMELKVPFDILALGGEVNVPTIGTFAEGKEVKLKVPSGSQVNDILRVKGKGFPVTPNSKSNGHAFYVLNVEVPKKLSKAEKEALLMYRQARG